MTRSPHSRGQQAVHVRRVPKTKYDGDVLLSRQLSQKTPRAQPREASYPCGGFSALNIRVHWRKWQRVCIARTYGLLNIKSACIPRAATASATCFVLSTPSSVKYRSASGGHSGSSRVDGNAVADNIELP